MKKTVNFKKRLVSGLLALTMVLGFLPGNLFPAAKAAVESTYFAVESFTIDEDGGYTVTVGSGFDITGWAGSYLAVALDGYGPSGTARVPSSEVGTSGVTTSHNSINAVNNRLSARYNLATGTYAAIDVSAGWTRVGEGTDPYLYTKSGKIPGFTKSSITNAMGSTTYTSSSGTINKDDALPMCGIVYYGVAPAKIAGASCKMTLPAPAGVTGTDFTFVRNGSSVLNSYYLVDSGAGYSGNGTTAVGGVFTVGGTDLSNAYVEINLAGPGGKTAAVQSPSGLVTAGSGTASTSVASAKVVGTSAEDAGTLQAGQTYYLLLRPSATWNNNNNGFPPIFGTATLHYEISGNPYTEKINIMIRGYDSTYITVDGGITIRGTEESLAGATVDTTALGFVLHEAGLDTITDKTAKFQSSTGTYTTIKGFGVNDAITDLKKSNFGLNADGLKLKNANSPYTDTLRLTYKVMTTASTSNGGTPKDIYVDIPVTIIVDPKAAETRYDVHFDLNGGTLGGSATVADQSVVAGGYATEPTGTLAKDGAVFAGWYTGAGYGPWVFGTDQVNEEITLYAHWTEQHKVTFHENTPSDKPATGGTVSGMPTTNPQLVNSGVQATTPSNPTLRGYKFLGWDTNPNRNDGGASWTNASNAPMVTNDLNYYAIWEAEEPKMDPVIFGAKQNTKPTLDTTAVTPGMTAGRAKAGGHSATDFTYEFSANGTDGWANNFVFNNVTFDYDTTTGDIRATGKLDPAAKKDFYVRATSKLNGRSVTVTVTLQVPPRINGGKMATGTSLLPGNRVTVGHLTLTDGTKIPTNIDWSKLTVQWYWGYKATMWGSTNVSEQGPKMKEKIDGQTDPKQVVIPNDANVDSYLWMKVTGDGTDVDKGVTQNDADGGETEAVWVNMGVIGKEVRDVQVVPSVWSATGTKVTSYTDISGSVTPARLGKGDSAQLNTVNRNAKYEFVGWSMSDSNTGYTDGTVVDNTNYKVQGEGTHLASGRNVATFTMKKLPEASTITVYAVYTEVQSHTVNVVLGTGVKEVSYSVGNTESGKKTSNFSFSATAGDIVSLIATAADNYSCEKYEFNPNSPNSTYKPISGDGKGSVTFNALADITITFSAKSVSDLQISGVQNYVSQKENYTGAGAVYTATITNPGARNASIDTGESGLYVADSSGNFTTTKYTGNDFTVSTIPSTVTAGAAATTVTVTPKDSRPLGPHTVWLQITENTGKDNTKRGENLVYRQKITFVVTADDHFTGTVNLNLNGAPLAGQTVTLRSGGTSISTTDTAGVYKTDENALNIGTIYEVWVGGNTSNAKDTGYRIHGANQTETVNLYTLTRKVMPDTPPVQNGSGSNIAIAVSLPAGAGVQVSLAGSDPIAYTENTVLSLSVPRTGVQSTQAYVFDTWSNNVNGALNAISTSVIMNEAKTVTATYVPSVSVIYNFNYTGAKEPFYTDSGHKSGDKVDKTALVPTRTGYDFVGWGATTGATTDNVTWPVTLGDTDTTVYAVWTQAAADWSTLPTGEYGRDYTGNAVVTGGNLGTGLTYTVGAWDTSVSTRPSDVTSISNLSDIGLSYNGTTHLVTGRPTKAGKFGFCVTATRGGVSWKNNYTLTVGKATPTITGVRFTHKTLNTPINDTTNVADLRIYATVTAPYWNGSSWGTADYVFNYTSYDPATGTTKPGKLNITSPADLSGLASSSSVQATVTLTPSGNTAVSGQTFDSIYKTATGTGYINKGSQVYSFEATPNPVEFPDVPSDKTATQFAGIATPVTVTITNGKLAGKFSYKLENLDGTPYPASGATADFIVTGTGISTTDTSIAADGTATLTIKPDANKLWGHLGTYTMFIRVVEKNDSGDVVASERIPVTLTVTPGDFTGVVKTMLHSVTTPTGTQGQIPGTHTVALRVLGQGASTAKTATWSANRYEATGLTAGTTYSVWVDGIQVPATYVTYNAQEATAHLYEVKLANDLPGGENSNLTGAGYYLKDQVVAISTDASVNVTVSGSTAPYDFKIWNNGTADKYPSVSVGFAMPEKPVTMTAKYEKRAATKYKVTYDAGAGVTGVIVPSDTNEYAADATVTVSPSVPVRTGYEFKNWNVDGIGTRNPSETFTMPSGDVKLTAVWEPVKITDADWTCNLPTGTYGSDYVGSVSMDTSKTGPVTYTASGLPGGLTMATNGVITGIPYEVKTKSVTFTARNAGGQTWTTTRNITVNKAKPILVVTGVTGATVDGAYEDAVYKVSAYVPVLANETTWAKGASFPVTTTAGSKTATDVRGSTLTIVSSGTFTADPVSVQLKWEPSTTEAGKDPKGNLLSEVYEPGTVYANVQPGANYGISVDRITHTWQVKAGYTIGTGTDGTVTAANEANPLTVTITNTGDQATGDLTLKLGPDSKFELGTGITSPVSSIDKDGSVPITVQPKADVTEGVYTDTLTIENTTTKVKATVALTLVVTQADEFGFSINTYLNSAADPTVRTKDNVPGGIVLRPVSGGVDVPPSTPTTAGEYKWTGLKSNMSYSVVVNGHVTTRVVTVNTDPKSMEIDLYQVILKQDPANTGATLQLTNASSTGAVSGNTTVSYYYVPGQPYQASTNVPSGKAFVKWTRNEHTAATSSTPVDDSTSSVNYRVMATTPMTLTANFVEEVKYEIRLDTTDSTFAYDTGKGLGDILNGGTLVSDKYMVDGGATFGISVPMDGLYSITKAGHTFRGWATSNSATVGAYAFTANTEADNGDGNENRIITLYPVWTEDSDLALAPGVIKGVYKHELVGQQVGPATGGTTPYGFAPMTGLPFGLALGSQTAGTVQVNGKPNDVGTATATITVTDNDGATATADYAFVIEKANVVPAASLPTGSKIRVDSLTDTAVTGLLTGTQMNGDGTGENTINGSWSVKTGYTLPTTPGTYAIPVVFTPENKATVATSVDRYGDHYNPYETTITVEVTAKLITAATIRVDKAATGGTPNTLATVKLHANTLVSSDSGADYTNDVEITKVAWSPVPSGTSGTFAANTAYTVTVYLKIRENSVYRFDTTKATTFGTILDTADGPVGATNQLSLTAETASFSLEFPAEATKLTAIDVTVGTLGVGSTTTNVTSGKPAQYTVTGYKWVEKGTTTQVVAPGFVDGSHYDVLVTVKPEAGYAFDPAVFGKDPNAELRTDGTSPWNATVNTDASPATGKTATVETKLNTDDGTIQIRYSFFEPKAETLVAISGVTGDLGVYYAQMSDASGHKHYDSNAIGHKSGIGFTFDPSGITVTATYKNQADGSTTNKTVNSGRTFYVLDPDNSTNKIELYKDGGSAKTFGPSDLKLDGQMVYVQLEGLPADAATQVDRLTVKELWVKEIAAETSKNLPKPKLEYTANESFAPGTKQSTEGVTVSFNTDTSALSNAVTLTGYGVKDLDNNTPTNYFFALDAAGTDANQLTTATKMTAAHNGATVYLCYADVNDHVVSVPVGTLKIKSDDLSVTITDGNGHDPEYGDKLTAEPAGGEGNYTYQWEKKNGDTWVPISGANGPDYVPTGDDIGDTIRVKITDSTGAEVIGDKINGALIVIRKRSVNFDVAAWDKTVDTTATNIHEYTTNDFTLKTVPDGATSYGGILPVDQGKVTLNLNAATNTDTNRPPYNAAAVGSKITWPAVTNDGANGSHTEVANYIFGGDSAAYYRLAPQGAMANKGEINPQGLTTVSHVDVHFAEMPIFNHSIPGTPTGVTLDSETKPGSTDTKFTATWYNGTSFDVTNLGTATSESEFGTGTYTVVVKVRPKTESNFKYGDSTKFYFHFGADETVEVLQTAGHTDKKGVYHDTTTDDYVMWFTFDPVARPKIAHVNVSVVQPVVEATPNTTVTENQVLGTDGSDRKDDLTPGTVTWTPTVAKFAGDTAYTAKFDLTAINDFEFDDNVNFVVNGVGPFVAGDTGDSSNIITKVTAKQDGANDKIYHVEVVFAQLKGGKVDLTDVVVDASVPAEGEAKAGPSVATEKQTIYDLKADSTNKWQYWDGSKWADVDTDTGLTSGKFLAGKDYRVTATVELKDTTHYQIGANTKFYLAGQECKTNVAADLNGGSDMTLTKDSTNNKYTLIQEFRVPANEISMVTVTYPEPVAGEASAKKPSSYGLKDQVTIRDTGDTAWKTLTTQSDPTGTGSFTGGAFSDPFADGTYYMVEATIRPNTGYAFKTDSTETDKAGNTQVNINGILVNVDGPMGTKTDAKGTAIGWAMAVYDSTDKVIKARYITKTASVDKVIIAVTTNATAPAVSGDPTSDTYKKSGKVTLAVNGNGNVLTNRLTVGDVSWTKADGSAVGAAFDKGESYKAVYELTINETGYTYADPVKFTIHGIDVNTGEAAKTDAASGITVRAVRNSDTKCTVTVIYPETKSDTTIVDVTVNYTVPKEDDAPAVSLNYASTEQVTLDRTGLKNDDSNGSTWHTGTKTGTVVTETDTFGTGDYVVASTFAAKEGFVFSNATRFIVNGKVYTKADNNADVEIFDKNKSARVWHTFPGQDKTIVRVAANVQQPVAGETRSDAVSKILAQNKDNDDMLRHVNWSDVEWTVSNTFGSGYGPVSDNTFEANRYYRATFTVSADAANNYSFLAETSDKVDFLINGIFKTGTTWIDGADTATANGIKVTTTGSDNSYTVTVDFPVTGSVADILTVWGDVTAPKATVTAASSQIKVAAEEPYRIVTDSNNWYTDDACTSKFTGAFQPGVTYYAKLTVEVKPDMVGKYRFTKDTAGYINGVVPDSIDRTPTDAPTKITLVKAFEVPLVQVPVVVKSPVPTKGNPLPTAAEITEGDDTKYTFSGQSWAGDVEDDGTVKAGTTYTMTVTVEPKDGYTLPANVGGYTWAGAVAQTIADAGSDKYTVTFRYTTPPDGVQPVDEIPANATAPIATQTLDPVGWTSADFDVQGDVIWYEGTDTTATPVTGPAKYSQVYTAVVKVKLKDGKVLSADPTYKFNGVAPTSYSGPDASGNYTLTYTFPETGPEPADPALEPVITVREPVKGESPSAPVSPNNSVTIDGHTWTPAGNFEAGKTYTIEVEVDPVRPDGTGNFAAGQTIKLNTYNETIYERDGKLYVKHSWTLPADPPPETITVPGGSTTVTEELPVVTYWISDHGFTNDLTAEKMTRSGAKPTFTPKVSGKEGYTFKGWSEVDPATLKQGEEIKLVDPLTFSIKEDKTFYAVYDEPRFEHDHYVSGYPDGTFKPEQYITRAEVAAIVANACLDGFDNNENYGNPGNYSDVNPKKWYGNDIAYCTMYGVFSGYKDGTFKPDQYITRQELAVVVANMAGMQPNIGMPFTDASSINKWARDGVYTVYKNNWVSGYPDGTFRPKNNITRAETVAIFNGYLHRGVDKDGLAELTPYVLNAAAGGYEGDGSSLYMTWTDVPEKYWAYYHIIEAANDHDYHWVNEETKLPPEHWDAAYIDQEWRYREEFAVTYEVGSYGTAPDGSVLTLSVKSGGRPRTQPHIDAMEGYTFLGWSLTPDGAIVEPLQTTITGATTFYAVYEVETTRYTVRYDAGTNGAITGSFSESVIEGRTPVHVPDVNAHEGFLFLGWAESPDGTLVRPASLAVTADKTYYAVYEAEQPQVQLQRHVAYMSGYDDGTFRPSQAITRAEVVAMVVRALGTDYDPDHVYDTSSVTDVEGHSAQNMIGYCIEKGIFSGYKDGTFLPEGTMTRQEFAVVIANLSGGAQENQGLPFTDADSVNKWARNAVYTVYVNGWIGGYKDGSFQPKNNITRAEAAVIFNGFLGRSVDKTSLTDVPAGATSPWSDVKVKNWAYQSIMEATASHSFYLEEGVEHWVEP